MSYFPAFINLSQQKILIVGGGNVAYEKLERLLDFTDAIDVIAKELSTQMQASLIERNLSYEKRAYKEGDIQGYDIVIIAVDNIPLQAAIYKEARNYRCLCNAVDSIEYCDFIFPAYVKEGDLTVAISTSGASPAFAKHFKRYLKTVIPNSIASFLKDMRQLRKTMPKGKERMQFLDKKAKDYMNNWSNNEQC